MKEKRKGIAKVMALKNWSCEGIKENVAPEIGPKSFETFKKHGPVSQMSRDFSGLIRVPLFPATGFSGPKRSRNFREKGPRAQYTKQINPDFSLHNPLTIGRHQLFTHERVLRFGLMLMKKTTTAYHSTLNRQMIRIVSRLRIPPFRARITCESIWFHCDTLYPSQSKIN